ncbi:hypothetical protein EV291_11997 [Rhizobium sp. BK068]|nr:hypothetical protein EV291_11997 [Rhizobium sp. BK068]
MLDLEPLVPFLEEGEVLFQVGNGHLQVAHLRFLLGEAGTSDGCVPR